MQHPHDAAPEAPLELRMDACHVRACEAYRELFVLIAQADRQELWRGDGARDMAHWLWMRYGISEWKARRWVVASHALEHLPGVAGALGSGELGIDKAVELCRFATPKTERDLLAWAMMVSAGAIRHRGDLEANRTLKEARELERSRSLRISYVDEGRRCEIWASLPAAEGRVVESAIEAALASLPVMPGEEGDADARRADALVALCLGRGTGRRGSEPTVVVHAPLEAILSGEGSACIESAGVTHAETARRLACSGRVQIAWEDASGEPIRLGRASREPSRGMLRLLRHRDDGCTFPGCGSRAYTHAHHVSWWSLGGRTDLENLALVCTFHHRLVHEHGWRIRRERGRTLWFRPDGTRHRAGPGKIQGARPPPKPRDALPPGNRLIPLARM